MNLYGPTLWILFLVNVWDWSVLKAGMAVAPGPLLAAILAPRFGKLAGQIGQRPLVIIGGVLLAASGLYGAVDVSWRSRSDLAESLLGRGVLGGEGLAAFGLDPLAADEELRRR